MDVIPQIFGAIGLVLDVTGVILLFYFGPPVINITKDGYSFIPYDANDESVRSDNISKFNRHQRFSYLALVLLLVGFTLQLIGTILQIRF